MFLIQITDTPFYHVCPHDTRHECPTVAAFGVKKEVLWTTEFRSRATRFETRVEAQNCLDQALADFGASTFYRWQPRIVEQIN